MADRSPVDVTQRVQRRQRQLLIRRLLAGLVALLLVAMIGTIAWAIGWSNLLDAQKVEVVGLTTLAPEQVTSRARVPLGTPLVRLDVDAVRERTEQVPQIKSAKVSRRFPHTIRIEVVERVPVLALLQEQQILLVDETGKGYTEVPQAPAGLRTATLASASHADDLMRRDLVALAQGLTGPLAEGNIRVETRDAILVLLPSGVTVFLGSVEQLDLKLNVASKLLAAAPDKKTIDVSSPSHPVVK